MALNSKDTLHSFVNKGIVVKSWFLLICFSDVSEYKVVQGPDKEFNFDVDEIQELLNAEKIEKWPYTAHRAVVRPISSY